MEHDTAGQRRVCSSQAIIDASYELQAMHLAPAYTAMNHVFADDRLMRLRYPQFEDEGTFEGPSETPTVSFNDYVARGVEDVVQVMEKAAAYAEEVGL